MSDPQGPDKRELKVTFNPRPSQERLAEFVGALARKAAREDHEAEKAARQAEVKPKANR